MTGNRSSDGAARWQGGAAEADGAMAAMTVLQVVPSLETGGAERTTVDIARALVGEGHRALVVSEGGRLVSELEECGADHITMPVASKRVHRMRANAARLADLVEEEGVDIIHARSRAPAWSALWASSWTFRPLVTTYHGAYTARTWAKNRYNSVMARGDVVIANSAFTAQHIVDKHPFAADRIVTIHRGIDLTAFDARAAARGEHLRERWGVPQDAAVVLHMARLSPIKGQVDVLEALAILAEEGHDDAIVVFAGDDQGRNGYSSALKERAKALRLDKRVRFVGHMSDVAGALGAATIAVQPSRVAETFGRGAVEAQAAQVPVIVSDLGAVTETVLAAPDVSDEKRTGWRVPAESPEALGKALSDALRLPRDQLATMGARGRAHVEAHFALAVMSQKTLAIYQRLLEDAQDALY